MNREYRLFVTFLCLLSLLISSTSSRFLVQKQGQNEVKVNEISRPVSVRNTNVEVNKDTMASGEYCSEKDEECRHGRMIAEAHLDYVYTEGHNP
ncbi:hypothetical protein K2173_018615 [Erythroxylum novogranatense]|uniref:Phytosulfokine n=1 Tax=Erythroxylum novogranatense TaxID=1862640 RepID=A0AAV8UDU1_9ROSI|nr:hypothetical protein K2173_018615 [Erythroxylum novogranatense]